MCIIFLGKRSVSDLTKKEVKISYDKARFSILRCMYFILSKVLLAFAMPLFWSFALFIYAALTRNGKRKQRMLIAGLVVIYFFSIRLTATGFARMWDVTPDPGLEKKYSTIILLGGFVSEDKDGNGFFNDASIRYFTAIRLLSEGKAGHIIFTGGNGNLHPDKFKEADFVKTRFKEAGIPDSVVLLEDNARNTKENAKFSKVLLQKRGLQPPYLLVTSGYHMRRAALIFKKQGLNVVPHPCDNLETKHFEMEDIIPNIEAMMRWNIYIKELIGYIVALVG